MKTLKIGDLLARLPIIQGGMGVGISLSGLASAVANQGGVGVISSAGLGVIYRELLQRLHIRQASGACAKSCAKPVKRRKGIIGVNVMVAMSNFADMVKNRHRREGRHHLLGGRAAAQPAVVPHRRQPRRSWLRSFRRPEPRSSSVPEMARRTTSTFPTRSWSRDPRPADTWATRPEQIADEHFSLGAARCPKSLSEVRRFRARRTTRHIPVIAGRRHLHGRRHLSHHGAGRRRCADGHALRHHGGVRRRSTEFKQSYIEASQQDIEIIQSPVGMPGRAIHNSFLERVKQGLKQPKSCPFNCIKTCDVTHSPYCIMHGPLQRLQRQPVGTDTLSAGVNAWRAEKIESVKELMTNLIDEFDRFSLKKQLAKLKK